MGNPPVLYVYFVQYGQYQLPFRLFYGLEGRFGIESVLPVWYYDGTLAYWYIFQVILIFGELLAYFDP